MQKKMRTMTEMNLNIEIDTEYIKLDSLLKFAAVASSGGAAKELIQSGKVKVNGEICLMRGKKIRNGDRIFLDGEEILLVAPEDKNAD